MKAWTIMAGSLVRLDLGFTYATDAWIAMVNAGVGKEVLMTDYRNSDRIIWDNQEIMNRLWDRCLKGEEVKEKLSRIEDWPLIQGVSAAVRGDKWHVTRLNERMRFLMYGPGQFFSGALLPYAVRSLLTR